MTEIESNPCPVQSGSEKVFNFLSDLNNHQHLMPPQVSDWWSTADEAKLKVEGLGALHLKKDVTRPFSYIKIVPIGKVPVDLFIEWVIETDGDNTIVKAIIQADLNMFMRMMAMKPLQSLANHMAAQVNGNIK